MKKHLLLVTLVLVFGLISRSQATPLFDVLETTYHIDGRLGYKVDGELINKEYDFTSSDALNAVLDIDEIPDNVYGLDNHVIGSAGPDFLYSEIYDYSGETRYYTGAGAWSETIFQPLFNATGPMLSFYSTFAYPHDYEIWIRDNTLGVEIFNPEADWDIGADINSFSFYYDDWNVGHTYTLFMGFEGSTNAVGHHHYEMGTSFSAYTHARVPEPKTSLLFGTAIAGLIGLKLRRRKKLSG